LNQFDLVIPFTMADTATAQTATSTNAPATPAPGATAGTTNAPADQNGTSRGLPYYEKLRRELRDTIAHKRAMDRCMVSRMLCALYPEAMKDPQPKYNTSSLQEKTID
jgi:hypothetical protein